MIFVILNNFQKCISIILPYYWVSFRKVIRKRWSGKGVCECDGADTFCALVFGVFCRVKYPRQYADIINAKKITLTDGRNPRQPRPPSTFAPFARSPLPVRRCRSRSPTLPKTHPKKSKPKHTADNHATLKRA